MPVFKTHFFPPFFVSKSGCVLYSFWIFLKFKNAFLSRETDPKRQYFRHPYLLLCNGEISTNGILHKTQHGLGMH